MLLFLYLSINLWKKSTTFVAYFIECTRTIHSLTDIPNTNKNDTMAHS
jgi:hypothetical protein